MATAIRADYCTNMTINNCSFSGFNNCIEMNFCTNFNILGSGFLILIMLSFYLIATEKELYQTTILIM